MTNLFQLGSFDLSSGATSHFKIECDALTDDDWATLALLVWDLVGPFSVVEGVPRGGLKLAKALEQYVDSAVDRLLIVDDVLTTGRSISRFRNGRQARGVVVFARRKCPVWVTPLFSTLER